MVRGIYSSAAGMTTQYKKIDVLGTNIANVNTPGYKDSDISFTTFGDEMLKRMSDDEQIGTLPDCVVLNGESVDLSSGAYKQTGITSDLAVEGNGFFAVQSPGGEVKYTRSGDFSVDGQGYLTLTTGERLLGDNGAPINVGGDHFTVLQDGTVSTAAGTVGKINVYMPQNNTQGVQKRTDGFFNITGAVPSNGSIKQGWLEDSNTDIVGNMTEMMEATRAFQGCQQAFQVSDDALEKVVTQIGTLK